MKGDRPQGHLIPLESTTGYCTICMTTRGMQPTDCPGRPLSEAERKGVFRGRLDYVGGQWLAGRQLRRYNERKHEEEPP